MSDFLPQEFDFRITGSTEPDSLVTLQQSGIGVIQQVYADSAGQWVAEAQNVSLSDSRFEFSAIATDLGGNISGPSNLKVFQPNIILVNVDDMRADELQYLPFVSTQLASQGTVFTNMFSSPTALCGPSRATLMTGLFADAQVFLEMKHPWRFGKSGSFLLDFTMKQFDCLSLSGMAEILYRVPRTP